MKDIQKPLILALKEAEAELINAVNGVMGKYSLPCYLAEFLVDKIHRQLIEGKRNEIAAASIEYEAKVAQSGEIKNE